MNPDSSFLPARDRRLLTFLPAFLFGLAPLYPQLSNPEFAFFFRSMLFLLLGVATYRLGWPAVIGRMRACPITLPFMMSLLIAGTGTLYSPDPYRAKIKLALLITAFVLYAFALLLSHELPSPNGWLIGLAIGAGAAALHALYLQWTGNAAALASLKQYRIYDTVMQAELIRTLEANRAMGRFANPNHLAGYLILGLWPLWALWRESPKKVIRCWVGASGGLFLLVAIYRTYSRSGLIVLMASLLLLAAYEYIRSGKKFPIRMVLTIAVALLLLGAGAVLIFKDRILGGRLLTFSTVAARFHFYRGGFLMLRDHPWFGTGTEGFESYYCEYLRPGDLESRYVHNIVLEAADEGGVLGLFIFFWTACAILRFLVFAWKSCQSGKTMIFAAFGSVLTLFTLSLVDFHNNLMEMLLIPAVLLGWVGGKFSRAESNYHLSKRIAYGFSAGMALTGLVFVFFPFLNIQARENGGYLLLDGQKAAARSAYERAVLFDRTDAESWNQLSRIWADIPTISARERSLECAQQAARWAPRRASLRADYANALFTLGYTDLAIQEMRKAQQLFPARPQYHSLLADYYQALGRTSEVKLEQQIADELQRQIEARKP